MSKPGFAKLLAPSLTVFISSACIMIIELVASRLIARHLGSSLYTWTSVIGVVLAGITIGNYIGGRIADKFQARKTLACLFGLASVACVIIIVLNNFVGNWVWLWHLNWPTRVFLHIAIVFLLPSTILGTISPVVAKMALDQGQATGKTVGTIYAWGAAGSIAGTFLAGFYLIAAMGTINIIWTVSIALLILAILYWAKFWFFYAWAAALAFFLFLGFSSNASAQTTGTTLGLREKADPSIIYRDETPYCYVAVQQISKTPDHRLFLQDKLKHSEIILDDFDNLQYFHTAIFASITKELSKNKSSLSTFNIGGGGYVFPQFIEKHWPGSRIDVAEIDPGVTKAALAAFGLKPDSTINTINLDARNYIDNLLEEKRLGKVVPVYDFIYEDAFSDYNVPFQLVTKEFNDKISDILSEDGVYMINLIDVLDIGYFLGSYTKTLLQTFPHVNIVTEGGAPKTIRTTFTVIASKKEIDVKTIILNSRLAFQCRFFDDNDIALINNDSNNIVLTDDYSPVDNFLAPVVKQSAKEILATKYFEKAEQYKKQEIWQNAIDNYGMAIKYNPSVSLKAYNEIGLIYVYQGKYNDGISSFLKAIEYYNQLDIKQHIIGSIQYNLAMTYKRINNNKEAASFFSQAIESFKLEIIDQPHNHQLYNRLGDTLAMTGRFDDASKAFSEAHRLDPNNHVYYGNLIRSLEFQGRFDDAIVLITEQIALLIKEGDIESAQQLEQYRKGLQQKKVNN